LVSTFHWGRDPLGTGEALEKCHSNLLISLKLFDIVELQLVMQMLLVTPVKAAPCAILSNKSSPAFPLPPAFLAGQRWGNADACSFSFIFFCTLW
jgi:hypothetical protein